MAKNTHFGSILFHSQSDKESIEDEQLEAVLDELDAVLSKHGFTRDEYEFSSLPGDEYTIAKCSICGYLTLYQDAFDGDLDDGDIFTSIRRVVRTGRVIDGQHVCDDCRK